MRMTWRAIGAFVVTVRVLATASASSAAPPVAPPAVKPIAATQTAKARATATLPNPPIRAEHADSTVYSNVGKHLYHAGIRVTDVDQGAVGDCYFIAGIAAVAHQNPQLIKKAITPNLDGTVSVRLYQPDGVDSQTGTPRFKPVTVRIDRQVPTQSGKILYARGHNTRHVEQWPALLEKALAKVKNGYDPLVGGYVGEAISFLTGKPNEQVPLKPDANDEVFVAIKNASAARRPMGAGTWADTELPAIRERLSKLEPASPAADIVTRAKDYNSLGLVPAHAYTVLGVDEKDGHRMIVLRNPAGHGEPPRTGLGTGPMNVDGDGIFQIPVEAFTALFSDHVDIGAATP